MGDMIIVLYMSAGTFVYYDQLAEGVYVHHNYVSQRNPCTRTYFELTSIILSVLLHLGNPIYMQVNFGKEITPEVTTKLRRINLPDIACVIFDGALFYAVHDALWYVFRSYLVTVA